MKRIISLILVLALTVLALASCAYSYENDDMTQYADFDKDAFLAALGSLEIEDADFGTDEDVRLAKVADAIFTALAKEVNTDDKILTGKAGKYDVYYYNYYYTATIDGATYVFATDKMKQTGATKLQLGLSSNKDLNAKIAELLAGMDLAEGDAYTTDTSTDTVVALGNTVVVSYKKSYSKTDAEGATTTVSDTVTNLIVTLPDAAAAEGVEPTILDKLVGLKVAESGKSFVIYEDLNGDGTIVNSGDGAEKVEYSNVVVNWVIKSGKSDTVKEVTHTADKKIKDINGKEHNLKDVELTYHIYPTYRLAVAEKLTATLVIRTLLGSSLVAPKDNNKDGKWEFHDDEVEHTEHDHDSKGTLDVFHDDGYKNGDRVISAIIADLEKALDDLDTKETERDDAQKEYDEAKEAVDKAGDKATTTEKSELETAEKNLNTAKDEYEKADKKVDDLVTELFGCTKADAEGIEDVIVKEYEQMRYDSLETTYKNSIEKALAKEIYALVVKYTTFKKDENGWWKLPRQAVSEAYNRIVNNYKYTFYEGTYYDGNSSTSDDVSNYYKYQGNFNEFLKVDSKALGLKATATQQDVYDAIGAKAEAAVKETIYIYLLRDIYGDDVKVTTEDVDNFKSGYNFLILQYQMGSGNVKEEYYMPALQFDKIFNHILEEKDEDDYAEDAEYGKNKVQYVRVSYTFKDTEAKEA